MMESERKVLVYLDGTESMYTTSQYAVYLAKKYGMPLLGVYIVNNKALEDLARNKILLPEEKQEYLKDLERDAQKYIREFVNLAKEKHVSAETHMISDQRHIHKAIIDLIKEHDIAWLIMGEINAYDHHKVQTVAQQLLYTSPCSIMIIKDPFRVEKLFNSV